MRVRQYRKKPSESQSKPRQKSSGLASRPFAPQPAIDTAVSRDEMSENGRAAKTSGYSLATLQVTANTTSSPHAIQAKLTSNLGDDWQEHQAQRVTHEGQGARTQPLSQSAGTVVQCDTGELVKEYKDLKKGTKVELLTTNNSHFRIRVLDGTKKTYWIEGKVADYFTKTVVDEDTLAKKLPAKEPPVKEPPVKEPPAPKPSAPKPLVKDNIPKSTGKDVSPSSKPTTKPKIVVLEKEPPPKKVVEDTSEPTKPTARPEQTGSTTGTLRQGKEIDHLVKKIGIARHHLEYLPEDAFQAVLELSAAVQKDVDYETLEKSDPYKRLESAHTGLKEDAGKNRAPVILAGLFKGHGKKMDEKQQALAGFYEAMSPEYESSEEDYTTKKGKRSNPTFSALTTVPAAKKTIEKNIELLKNWKKTDPEKRDEELFKGLTEKTQEATENLADMEKAAIYDYAFSGFTGEGAPTTMKTLDPKKAPEQVNKLKLARSGLNKLPVFKGTTWRGEKDSRRSMFKEGEVVGFDKFVSSSTAPKTSFIEKQPLLLEFTGIKSGRDIRLINPRPEEYEVLFPPGSRFLVKSIEDIEKPKKTHIKLEELSEVQFKRTPSQTNNSAQIHEAAQLSLSGTSGTLPYLDTIQRSFGRHDVSHIRSHMDAKAAAGLNILGSEAVASGDRVAFKDSHPSLHTVAHEAAHVIQQQGKVQLKGGIGQTGDKYEQHADRVADAVVRGQSAESLLDGCSNDGAISTPVVQRDRNITADRENIVRGRAGDRVPKTTPKENIRSVEDIKGYGQGQKDKALVVRDASSMAKNPVFEQAALEWEDKFSGIAYNDARAKKPVQDGADKAIAYLKKKVGEWKDDNKDLQTELKKIQITDTGWSGGVGDVTKDVMDALESGPLGVQIAHLENFCNKILAEDLLQRDEKALQELLGAANLDRDDLDDAIKRIKKNKSRYALHDTKGEAAEQWHMRSERNDKSNKSADISKRTVQDLEDLNVKLDPAEKKFMGTTKQSDTLKWAEGARIWALNERDKWVYAMRQMSLPLAAGVSGTTARMMQNFSMLGVGKAEDNRLACIAYLLPTHHHSLVEIMEGAANNGGPAFSADPRMYRDIKPFTATELKTKVGFFPDERV